MGIKLNRTAVFYQVVCGAKTKRNRLCDRTIGDFQINAAHTDHFYCRDCKRKYELSTDGSGRITRMVVPISAVVNYSSAVTIVEAT